MTRLLPEVSRVQQADGYLHWDELRHREPPPGFSLEELWLMLKMARLQTAVALPLLLDKRGAPFTLNTPPVMQAGLHEIDRQAAGPVLTEGSLDEGSRQRYLIRSLREEAITSSQLEGAATTRRVADDMLRQDRRPATHGERMIYNNYQAMRRIQQLKKEPLTVPLILELHRILAQGVLDDAAQAGRLRQTDDVRVWDHRDGTLLHQPPLAAELPERLQKLCEFANQPADSTPFVHPAVRAILLHFMIGYDHPFVDGNGRAARALFYWSMARQGYWLAEFISISSLLRRAPAQYARAYLHTETDGGDTSYFVLHQLRVIRDALRGLHEHLRRQAREERRARQWAETALHEWRGRFNARQIALLNHALQHPDALYTVESHRSSHDVAYATARSDLLLLAKAGLLRQGRRGRALAFTVAPDLSATLKPGLKEEA
jgi:Fic family protein